MLIGYARVSTPAQNLDRQLAALRAEGCERVFADKATGATLKGRPQLAGAIRALGVGDVLIVAEWDRATRSMQDGVKLLAQIREQGAFVKVLDRAWLDLTTPIGEGVLAFLSALAADERRRIVDRAEQGREAARERGVRFGRPPALSGAQQAFVRDFIAQDWTNAAIAEATGVHPTTIGRFRRSLAAL